MASTRAIIRYSSRKPRWKHNNIREHRPYYCCTGCRSNSTHPARNNAPSHTTSENHRCSDHRSRHTHRCRRPRSSILLDNLLSDTGRPTPFHRYPHHYTIDHSGSRTPIGILTTGCNILVHRNTAPLSSHNSCHRALWADTNLPTHSIGPMRSLGWSYIHPMLCTNRMTSRPHHENSPHRAGWHGFISLHRLPGECFDHVGSKM